MSYRTLQKFISLHGDCSTCGDTVKCSPRTVIQKMTRCYLRQTMHGMWRGDPTGRQTARSRLAMQHCGLSALWHSTERRRVYRDGLGVRQLSVKNADDNDDDHHHNHKTTVLMQCILLREILTKQQHRHCDITFLFRCYQHTELDRHSFWFLTVIFKCCLQ